jgi:hypothetical protein
MKPVKVWKRKSQTQKSAPKEVCAAVQWRWRGEKQVLRRRQK